MEMVGVSVEEIIPMKVVDIISVVLGWLMELMVPRTILSILLVPNDMGGEWMVLIVVMIP